MSQDKQDENVNRTESQMIHSESTKQDRQDLPEALSCVDTHQKTDGSTGQNDISQGQAQLESQIGKLEGSYQQISSTNIGISTQNFQSNFQPNLAIFNDQDRQRLMQEAQQEDLNQIEMQSLAQAQAFLSQQEHFQGQKMHQLVGQGTLPHSQDSFEQANQVYTNDMVTLQNQQQWMMNVNPQFQLMAQTEHSQNFAQNFNPVFQEPNKNQSNQIGQIMGGDKFCTPQKLAVSSQNSIGALTGDAQINWQSKLQEDEQVAHNQRIQLIQSKDQQFSSEAKLQVNDLNLACHQKIPQTDQMASGQRKLSQNMHEESNNAYGYNNIIFSESVNKFSEYQEYDPSDSHSNFPINPNFAQINDLLEDNDEDVHFLNQQEPKMSFNHVNDDAASLVSSTLNQNSIKPSNGSNLLQANLVPPQRGQSSCENNLPSFKLQTKFNETANNFGMVNGQETFFGENNRHQGMNYIGAQMTTRIQNMNQSNLPISHGGPGGPAIRHPSMDSRQPPHQMNQIENRDGPVIGTYFPDQFNQSFGLNNIPSGIIASGRKSVQSNQELQKNNFFKEENHPQEYGQNIQFDPAAIQFQNQESGANLIDSQNQAQEHQFDTSNVQQIQQIQGLISSQKIESPILPSVGRSLNLTGLRPQDNLQIQRSENMVRERRLTGDQPTLMSNEQFAKSFNPSYIQSDQSAERRQDDFCVRLTCVSEGNQQYNQLQSIGQQQQVYIQQANMSGQQDELQMKQTYLSNQQQRLANRGIQYRGASYSNQESTQSRQFVQAIQQKQQQFQSNNRIVIDDPHNKGELEHQISQIQQMSQFNKNKLDQGGPALQYQQAIYQQQIQQQQVDERLNDNEDLQENNVYQMKQSNQVDMQNEQQHQMMVQSQYYAQQQSKQQFHLRANQQLLTDQNDLVNSMNQLQIDSKTMNVKQGINMDSQAKDQMLQLQIPNQIVYQNTQRNIHNPIDMTVQGSIVQNMESMMVNYPQNYDNSILKSDQFLQQPETGIEHALQSNNLPIFYPQGQLYVQSQDMHSKQESSNKNNQPQQFVYRPKQSYLQGDQSLPNAPLLIRSNSGDIASQDLHIQNPNGFRALQQMAAVGKAEQATINSAGGAKIFGHRNSQKNSETANKNSSKNPYHGMSNELSVDLSDQTSPEKNRFNQNTECSQVLSSSRSSQKSNQKQQSKTAQAQHEMSTSQKSSARKGFNNSGSESMHTSLNKLSHANQKPFIGSMRGDPSNGSRENSKGKIKGITSRGAASDDGHIILSSHSQYDSQNSKENTTQSNLATKQIFKGSQKEITATASSQKNQSDGNKRKSSINKDSSGLGLSSNVIQNEVQKEISDDLQNKKQSTSHLATGKFKSQSNYYDAKSMNEKISLGKSYNEGSQYSSKNSLKSGGNEAGGGSVNFNQNYDRLNQKSSNTLSQNAAYYGRKQSYSQGGSQNRNRSNQRMQINMQSGHSNSGHYGSNQSYDEFISQIQHDIKLAKGDPEKEFHVLDGNIMKLASKKVGSMFLQDYLKNADQQLINKIINQVDGKLADLMVGKYGNFFCSKLIEYLQPHQRIHFLKQISGKKFVEISCDERGTWALQNILHAAMKEEEYRIIEETIMKDDNISRLSKDKQGHHMINLIITSYPEPIRNKIFNYICNNFKELAQDQNGLCVMKKIIEYAKKDQMKQKQIVENIIIDSLEYVQHEFGNFVVQEIINLYEFEMCKGIYQQMEGHFQRLSLNKFSSKLIETCIDRAPIELQNQIVNEFCISPCLSKVVQGNFGNFVLQKSIEKYLKSKVNKLLLIESIVKCLDEVSDYKVQEKWGDHLLVRYLGSLDTHNLSEIDIAQSFDLNSFLEKKRNVELLLSQKMKDIHYQHQMQKQFIQNQMQGGKHAHYSGGNFQGGRGGQGNSYNSKYMAQGGHSSGGNQNYINNKHHQKIGKRGGTKGGHSNQQSYRNSLNSINNDQQNQYDGYDNHSNPIMYHQNYRKFDPNFQDQAINPFNQTQSNYAMIQQPYGQNNYQMNQQLGDQTQNLNDTFGYQRFDNGPNFIQQPGIHSSESQSNSMMGRHSTSSYNQGQYNAANNVYLHQQERGFDNRNQRGGYYQQNQQLQNRGQFQAQYSNQSHNQEMNKMNSQVQQVQFQKKGRSNQAPQNTKIQKGTIQGSQNHGGQSRKDYNKKQVFKKSNIKFAVDQGNNQAQHSESDNLTNANTVAATGNSTLFQSSQNSTPNLTQAGGQDNLGAVAMGHANSQQQLEQNNAPSSLFNNDPLGITTHGSSGGTTNRENENELE